MRKAFSIWLCLALFAAIGIAAQKSGEGTAPGEPFVGTWTGGWEGGGGTGGFELILEKAKDGSIGGRVSVTGEPTYKAILESASFEGPKMTASYTIPVDERIGVVLVITFESNSAKGTWVAREKASGTDVAAGTLAVTKK